MNAAYCRSSTWNEGKVSLQSQKSLCQKEAKKSDLVIPDEHILFEKGKSARNLNRPQMKVLLDWIHSGSLDHGHLFVPSYDRLTRELNDLNYLINLFDEHAITVHSVKEKIPATMSRSARTFYIYSLGAVAQAHLETSRQHALRYAEQRRKDGKPNGSAPYGYRYTKEKLVPTSAESHVVKKIFALYLSGLGYKKISQRLKEEGITIYARDFLETDIYRILGNQTYAGFLGKGSTTYKGNHQPIVSLEVFERVQQIRKQRQQPKKHDVQYPLTRKLRCSCGWYVGVHTYKSKNGKLRRYYECANPVHRESKTANRWSADNLEEYVLQVTKDFLSNEIFLDRLLHQMKLQQAAERNQEEKQQEYFLRQKKKLFLQYEEQRIDAKEFTQQLSQLNGKRVLTGNRSTITMSEVKDLFVMDSNVPDAFFFQLIEQIRLSDLNEAQELYLTKLPEHNLLEWGGKNERK
ncbi:recombinase family protein [Enterococcus hulanensis]|uniref:recombinase family protein n=1 Tax=Enterococcus hulanensis TaxID=2559929 RepID=UPI001A8E2FB7|nr:recombinase family protein [Enterococcus hulanensis]MBO0457745.1 recombinase family protein [Enterococcus hulanensis]